MYRLILIAALLIVINVGQTHAITLNEAIGLMESGKITEAHGAFNELLASSPTQEEEAAIRYYDALTLYEMEDFGEYIKTVGALRTESVELTANQRARLDSRLVRAYYDGKHFEDTRREAQAFLQTHGQTASTTETKYMRFINSKAMWDMARKDYIDAAKARMRGGDPGALNQSGAARMQQFLSECDAFTEEDRKEYVMQNKMSLEQMKWHARILAGEEEQIATELQDASEKERIDFSYYRAWAHYYFWPENRMENHGMLKTFAETHPGSEWAPRARYFAAKTLHQECVDLLARTKNVSLKYDGKEHRANEIKQQAAQLMNTFLEECEEGERLGAFSLAPNLKDGLGSRYLETSILMRDENMAASQSAQLAPAERAKAEFEIALGIYRTYGTSEWGKALEIMDRTSVAAEDTELRRSATNYGMAIEYNWAMFLLRTAYTDPPGMDNAMTSETKRMEGMRLVGDYIEGYESAMANDLLPGKESARTLAEERYWECKFIVDSGDELLEQSESWPDEKRARLVNQQAHAYYHSSQWERFRQTVRSYRSMPGVSESALLDIDVDLFETYELTNEFTVMIEVADALLANYEPGSKLWANALNARAIGKVLRPEPDLAGAAEDLDQVLAANIEHADLQNHIPTRAAYWRAHVAETTKDTTKLRNVVRMIRDDMPDNPYRMQALEHFKQLLQ